MHTQGTIMDLVHAAQKETRVEQERGDYLFRMLRNAETQIDILRGENESLKRKIEEFNKAEKKASSNNPPKNAPKEE